MGFTQEIFKRATIRGVADYLLYGIGLDEDDRDYEKRMDDVYHKFEQEVTEFDKKRNSILLDLANEFTSEAANVYTEIGLQAGILLMQDMARNIGKPSGEKKTDYQTMYVTLFKDVANALKHLHNSEDENSRKATEILENSQYMTEEIFIDSADAK